jgi:hypothetical protein
MVFAMPRGSEPHDREHVSTPAHTPLQKQNWAGRCEPDREAYKQKKRNQERQYRYDAGNVEETFRT